jgi:hypothetical protein
VPFKFPPVPAAADWRCLLSTDPVQNNMSSDKISVAVAGRSTIIFALSLSMQPNAN